MSSKVSKSDETNWNLIKGHVNVDSIKETCAGKEVLGNASCADDMVGVGCHRGAVSHGSEVATSEPK